MHTDTRIRVCIVSSASVRERSRLDGRRVQRLLPQRKSLSLLAHTAHSRLLQRVLCDSCNARARSCHPLRTAHTAAVRLRAAAAACGGRQVELQFTADGTAIGSRTHMYERQSQHPIATRSAHHRLYMGSVPTAHARPHALSAS